MAIRDLIVRISAQSSDFEKKIASAQRSLLTFSERASAVSAAAFTGLTLPIAAFGGVALKQAADFEGLRRALDAVSGSAAETQKQLVRLRGVAELPGLGFKEAIQGSVRLQAVGFSAQLAERTLKAVGNALVTVGGGREELAGVIRAFSQIEGKGKVFAEEINQVAERLPQVRAAMKAAFGTANTEEIQKLGLTSRQFIEGLVTEFEKLPQVTGGLKNAFENLKDNIEISMAEAGNAIAPFAQSALDVLNPLIRALGSVGKAFSELPQPIQAMSVSLVALAAAVGPVSFLVGKFVELRVAILAANAAIVANPIIATLVIGAAGAAIAINDVNTRLAELQNRADNLDKARTTALQTFADFQAAAKGGDAEIRGFGAAVGDFGLKVRIVTGANAQLADSFKTLGISSFGDIKTAASDAKKALDDITAAYKRGEASAFDVRNATNAYHGLLQRMGLETVTVTERHKKHAETVRSLADAFRDMEESLRGRAETARLTQELFRLQEAAAAGRDGISTTIPEARALSAIYGETAGTAFDLTKALESNSSELRAQVNPALAVKTALEGINTAVFDLAANNGLRDFTNDILSTAQVNQAAKLISESFKDPLKDIKFPTKPASEFGRQVSTVLTDFSRGIVDVIDKTKSLGDAMRGVAQEASRSILRYFIEQGTKQVIASLGQLISKLFDVQGLFGSVFGGTSQAASRVVSGGSQAASGAVSTVASAALQGAAGYITAASTAVSAVFEGLQFFQFRRIEQDLGRVEVTTRGLFNQSIAVQDTLNRWLPYLGGIQELLQGGQIAAAPGGGGVQSITFNIYETENARSTLTAITRELRTLGVVRG